MSASATRYDVFLSHNSADKPAVQALADSLRATGIAPFLDIWHLIPGTPWQEGIEEALEASATVAVFVGPSGISPWHNEEMHDALDRAVRSRDDYRVIPVLLPGADEGSVSRFLARRVWVDFRSGLSDEAALQRLVAGVKGEAVEVGSYKLPDEPAPYRGLLPFEAEHARFFFGRDDDVRRLVEKLGQQRFVAVVGASGNGKSSLVMAGLLPKLAKNALWDSGGWKLLRMTPGSEPLRGLASQLATLAQPGVDRLQAADALVERLGARRDGLRSAAAAYMAEEPRPLLLFVDQFEELFTQCQEGPERCRAQSEQFVANLADAVEQGGGQIRVLITLRADFLDRCLTLPALRGLLEDRQVLLGPMDEPTLREVIVRPAGEVGALFGKGLVALILRDVGDEPGRLPLLEHALHELWLARRGPWLTLDDYEASGGVQGALNRRAQATYEALDEAQQRIARNIFLRLTALGEGVADTRRRARREELYTVGVDRKAVEAVVQALTGGEARLLVVDGESVQVAHEALIQGWDTLRRWLEEDRDAQRVQRWLTEAAMEWEQNQRDESYLYQGSRLIEVEEWASTHGSGMNRIEEEFVEASRYLRQRKAAEEKLQEQARQRRARVITVMATALAILLIPALFVGINAWMFARRQSSNWQWTGFPSESVLSIAVAPEADDPTVPRICVGAADIGIGCSSDLQDWNIYQIGFPVTASAQFNDRDSLLSNLTGSTWSTKIQGVEALAFDLLDPHRIVASFAEGHGLFLSEDAGAHWRALKTDGSGTDADFPTEVDQLALDGDHLFVLRKSETTSLQPEERGSLHLSEDRGLSWKQIGGPGTDTGVMRSFSISADRDGQDAYVYAAGEDGLYGSSAASSWRWQQLIPIRDGEVGVLVAASAETVHLATYDRQSGVGALYRWSPQDGPVTGRWAQFEEAPRSMVVTSSLDAEYLVWVLFDNGEVVAVSRQGSVDSRGRRPGWPWSFAKTLEIYSFEDGELVLMGHRDGLLEYCPRTVLGLECGSQKSAAPQAN